MTLVIQRFSRLFICVACLMHVTTVLCATNKTDNIEKFYEIIKEAGWADDAGYDVENNHRHISIIHSCSMRVECKSWYKSSF